MRVTDIYSGLTQERLHSLFLYDPATGVFTRKIRVGQRDKVGDVAGYVSKATGYHYIKIDSRSYLASRVAWLYMTGQWPVHSIDHKNEDKADTRWDNLRPATVKQNSANRGATSRSTTGMRGVFMRDRQKNPYFAMIRVDGRLHHIGVYPTAEEANAAYTKRAQEIHGEYARGTS